MMNDKERAGRAPEPSREDLDPRSDIEVGDELYFRHNEGPCHGKVICRGKAGVHLTCEHGTHKVRYEHVLGHRVRAHPMCKVVDSGDDGAIVEDPDGRRRYIHDPGEPETHDLAKSLPVIMFISRGGLK